jgi:hypothetical protein
MEFSSLASLRQCSVSGPNLAARMANRRLTRTRFQPLLKAAYAQVTLEMGREFHLVGVVDLEIRRIEPTEPPDVPRDVARFLEPFSASSVGPESTRW